MIQSGAADKRSPRLLVVVVACALLALLGTASWIIGASTVVFGDDTANAKLSRSRREYEPSPVEKYVFDHSRSLGLEEREKDKLRPSCDVWNTPNASSTFDLQLYLAELDEYRKRMGAFEPLGDFRRLVDGHNNAEICQQAELDPDGLPGIFKSGWLSRGNLGFVEPMLPPMRHPRFCANHGVLMEISYMVNDYAAFCRQLKPTSRTVFVDLGAALNFHRAKVPVVDLTDEFRKFGIHFDHIYAYEISPTQPKDVYEMLPEHLFAAYHWINLPVSPDPESKLNPWRMLMNNYREDDFVVVKLDIDTPVVETLLVEELRSNPALSKLVDVFYFEHHVQLKELLGPWGVVGNVSVKESMQLFVDLRRQGIVSHSWV